MYGILVDVTKCTGCERCVDACVQANHLDPIKAAAERATTRDGLSANRLNALVQVERDRFVRKSCMHCLEPSCVSACLVGGLRKTPEGPVVYDADRCIGCRYCMLACPFHAPRYEWDKTFPFMRKCDMCAGRISGNGLPACVQVCPNHALTFGPRETLLKQAHAQIAQASTSYLPHVWGEEEWGGTSVLFISDIDLSVVGWPSNSLASIPSLTEPLIAATPFIGVGVGLSMWALSAIIARRNRLMGRQNDVPSTGSKAAPARKEENLD